MVSRRLAVAALLTMLLTAACTGVPEAGAVHTTAAAQNVQNEADSLDQQAAGPAVNAKPAQIVQGLLAAIEAGDQNAAQQFLTADFQKAWDPTQQVLVFNGTAGPPAAVTGHDNRVSVNFHQVALIDSSGSYRRAVGGNNVTFTLVQGPPPGRQWRVNTASEAGTFIPAPALTNVLSPMRLYFPSQVTGADGVPRLVPDTTFMPRNTNLLLLVQQLIQGGPTQWLTGAVIPTTKAPAQVVSATADPTGLVTVTLQHVGRLKPETLQTLEAQLAYTLNADALSLTPPVTVSQIQLVANNQPLGQAFSLPLVSAGYNPDVLPPSAPLYYVSGQSLIMATRSGQAAPAGGGAGAFAATAPDTKETVIEHDGGVGQIAVSAAPAEVGGFAKQAVAGVLTANGTATLEVGAIPDSSEAPWTSVPLPPARTLSTPSFDAVGQAIWTVAATKSGSELFRVPYGIGVPVGQPEVVPITNAVGARLKDVTSLRLSRDGSRAAIIANGQAYVGVVALTNTATGQAWTVSGARPVTDDAPADVDIYWADSLRVGVVVRSPTTKVTTLDVVAADGYTPVDVDSTDAEASSPGIDGSPPEATDFSGGPQLLWVASVGGQLYRQPSPDSTGVAPDATGEEWDPLGPGTDPTYAG